DAIILADNLQRHHDMRTALRAYENQRRAELLRPLSEARCSAEWFERLPRYTDLKPHQFATLLQLRRSPLLLVLPPRLSYQLYHASERFTFLDGIRNLLSPAVKVMYGRRKLARRDGYQTRRSS